MKPIVIVGAGGYAQELLWIIEDINRLQPEWEFIGFIDPAQPDRTGQTLYDFPILGGFEAVPKLSQDLFFACGIGKPSFRLKESAAAEQRGWRPAALVHPSVIMARHVEIAPGAVIGAGCIVGPYARIGRHCSVNLDVTVGHNSVIGDFSVLSPGARISGQSVLEEEVFIGSNATVHVGRRLGRAAVLGANSFLVTNLKPGKKAMGNPAMEFGFA